MTLKRKNKLMLIMISLVMVLTLLGSIPALAAADNQPDGAAEEAEQAFYLTVRIPTENTTFLLPTSSYLRGTYGGKPYDWMVDWGDGVVESKSGTSSQSGGIPHAYALAGDYTITITPNGSTEAWFGAFGFYWTDGGSNIPANKGLVIGAPSQITPLMTRTSAQIDGDQLAPDYEWNYTFYRCVNLIEAPVFSGWDGISTVGSSFAANMLGYCESLAVLPAGFNLPQSLSEVGSFFAGVMFDACSSLTVLPDGFNLPQGITSEGGSFVKDMFRSCTSLVGLPDGFNLPPGLTEVGNLFAEGMFYRCESLTGLPEGFNLPQGITKTGTYFAGSMLWYCSSLTGLPVGFNLPQGITEVGGYFTSNMLSFSGDETFQINQEFTFPAGISAESTNAFRSTLFLSDLAPMQNRTAASIIGDCPTPDTVRYTFGSCFSDIDDIPFNWSGREVQLVAGSGDLNGDGVVTMDEVIMILQVSSGTVAMVPEMYYVIDMDFDSRITMADVVLALHKTV
ncbi:MAG: hypothetical protein FWH40_04350 [Coriobacteriia bacterium]|nr:hypothetical protein [Coriobacteriia bacterium]